VGAKGVLANDTNADGDPLTAALLRGPKHGKLTLNADGSFTYVPASGYHGTDNFTYTANDGTAASYITTVRLTVKAVVPAAPTSLSATAAGSGTMLQWAAGSPNTTRFIIERSTSGGTGWTTIARTAASIAQYFDGSISLGGTYLYRVRARNGAGDSAHSAVIKMAYVERAWRIVG
jgi:VCBS repeat-containing protein